MFLMGTGWACYQANIIHFGIDKLIDASVSQYKALFFLFFFCLFVHISIFATMGNQLINLLHASVC